MAKIQCPVCHDPQATIAGRGMQDASSIACARCGEFEMTGTLLAMEQHDQSWTARRAAIVSHALRRMQAGGRTPLLSLEVMERIEATGRLATPAEQADHLVLWLGDQAPGPAHWQLLELRALAAIIGALDTAGAQFIVEWLRGKHIIKLENSAVGERARLTFEGWQRYENLKRGRSDSRRALMAMQFSNAKLKALVDVHLRLAVEQTGYTLFLLNERARAGLIDLQLAVELRESRFIVADLSDANPGAYWEAGFATGLGKPVIYLCYRDLFDEVGTHFDTNHYHTIKWHEDDPASVVAELKATIRATLPGEAVMTDDPA